MAKRNEFTTLTEAEMLEVVGGYFNPLDALKPTPQSGVHGNMGVIIFQPYRYNY